MSKKEELKKNPVRPLSPPAVSETFSILRILIEFVFDEIEYRLKGPCVSSSRGLCARRGNISVGFWESHFLVKGMRRANAVDAPAGGIGWTLEYHP